VGKIKTYEQVVLNMSILKLSVSSIGTYEKCPKNYHYRYIEKPDIEKNKWPATEFGSCAHLALELFHKTINNKSVPRSQYSKLMKWAYKKALSEFDIGILDQDVWSPSGDKNGLEYLKEILQEYLNKISSDGMPNVIGIEVSYNFYIDGTMIRGYIDRLDKIGDGEYRVVDYKTSKNKKYLNSFQLLVYAEAIRRMYPDAKIIHGSYMLLKHNCETMDWTFSDSDLEKVVKKISKRADMIKSESRWVKKPSILCNWCDYKKICQESWAD
jgi:ATP-dependent helicase/DNAse subunit B